MGCSSSKIQEEETTVKSSEGGHEEYIEGVVCKTTDLNDNDMKVFDLDEGKVLIIKQKGEISALGTKCTHYGAPLDKGVLGDGRIRCQWHGACFNIKTGDIEDFPGLDSLPCYKVTTENGQVKVRAKKSDLVKNARTKLMAKPDCETEERFVIIGGGPAGQTCVETLRQEGFKGHITLVAKEDAYPYDRVKVSKVMDIKIEKIEMRNSDFYSEHGINVLKNMPASSVNANNQTVTLCNGEVIRYDRLFIATGSKARKLNIPGADLKNVFTIRTYLDAEEANSQLSPDKHLVVLGSSFIAMEAANFCAKKVKSVTVVGRDTVPFKTTLGPEIGAAIQKMFEDNGIAFRMNVNPVSCNDDGMGNIKSVTLSDGTELPADICIMGTGSTYYTDFLKDSGINLRPDGGIEIDEYNKTNICTIFAGGDIAYAPVWSHGNIKSNIGHYPLAHYHGHIAAKNMLGKNVPLKVVPYFWTMLFGKSFRYSGHGQFDEVIYHGDVSELKYVAFYVKGDDVVGISSCQMDPVVSQYAERVTQGKQLKRSNLQQEDKLAWTKE